MKKSILCVVCAMFLAMSMVFSACSNGKYATMEDYVKSDAVQQQIASLEDTMANMGLELSVTGEGNKLIYTYTSNDITKSDALVSTLESSLEAQKETFTSTANTLKSVVNVDNPCVVVTYLDKTGEEIYSREFMAE